MTVLVTGAGGFIGFHISEYLLKRGDTVVGLDNLSPYYDVRLKEARLARLTAYERLHLYGSTWLTERAWKTCSPVTRRSG